MKLTRRCHCRCTFTFPWCIRRVPDCDFNSHAVKNGLPEAEYIDALIADPGTRPAADLGPAGANDLHGRRHASLFSAEAIDRLLCAIRARVNLLPDAEITLEANPGTFEADKFATYRAAGINRLSIGIQSFNDRHLQALPAECTIQPKHITPSRSRAHISTISIST